MMDSNLTIRVGYSYGGLKKRASNLIQYDRRAFLTMNIYEKILGCFMMQIIWRDIEHDAIMLLDLWLYQMAYLISSTT